MSNKVAIEVDNVSKLYRLGKTGAGSFLQDINRTWKTILGKEDPLTKLAVENNRENAGGENVWALRNISFSVQQGEILGVVGRNGAGKSTLLKILSQITHPTEGEIKIRGRIASLLEVGTGFHPELSGRENVYLNGAILGMSRKEITQKFDEIVEFSGVAKYLDTPVKRYSSGMRVRLGFAVAAHLEPEILVVDEVLAVGDAEFQKKAIGKMKEVSSQGGRTVLFVSHNMSSLRKLCTRGILLRNGMLEYNGSINDTIDYYFSSGGRFSNEGFIKWDNEELAPGGNELKLKSIHLVNPDNTISNRFFSDNPVKIKIGYKILNEMRNFRMNIQVHSSDDVVLFTSSSHHIEPSQKNPNEYLLNVIIPPNIFNTGDYKIFIQADIPNVKVLGLGESYLGFQVFKRNDSGTHATDILRGYFSPLIEMSYE